LPISFVTGILIGNRASHGVFYTTVSSLMTMNTNSNASRRQRITIHHILCEGGRLVK